MSGWIVLLLVLAVASAVVLVIVLASSWHRAGPSPSGRDEVCVFCQRPLGVAATVTVEAGQVHALLGRPLIDDWGDTDANEPAHRRCLAEAMRTAPTRADEPPAPDPTRLPDPSSMSSPDLEAFMDQLIPGDSELDGSYSDGAESREARAQDLARTPLNAKHEATARQLASLLTADRPSESATIRTIGEQLCAEGGRWLMVLVAHRAQHLVDPQWRKHQAARLQRLQQLFPDSRFGIIGGSGPYVRKLEIAWDGVCGWQH